MELFFWFLRDGSEIVASFWRVFVYLHAVSMFVPQAAGKLKGFLLLIGQVFLLHRVPCRVLQSAVAKSGKGAVQAAVQAAGVLRCCSRVRWRSLARKLCWAVCKVLSKVLSWQSLAKLLCWARCRNLAAMLRGLLCTDGGCCARCCAGCRVLRRVQLRARWQSLAMLLWWLRCCAGCCAGNFPPCCPGSPECSGEVWQGCCAKQSAYRVVFRRTAGSQRLELMLPQPWNLGFPWNQMFQCWAIAGSQALRTYASQLRNCGFPLRGSYFEELWVSEGWDPCFPMFELRVPISRFVYWKVKLHQFCPLDLTIQGFLQKLVIGSVGGFQVANCFIPTALRCLSGMTRTNRSDFFTCEVHSFDISDFGRIS